MAKALLGHVGGPDLRMVNEMRRLQQRVRDLEAELDRLQLEKDALVAEMRNDLLVRPREPVLT
jgi:cell division protein FtsB